MYNCPFVSAEFISPKISRLRLGDPTVRTYTVKTKDSGDNFQGFLNLGRGQNLSVNADNIDYYISLASELENEDIVNTIFGHGATCSIARSVTTTNEILSYFSSTPMDGIVKILAFEKHGKEWLIAYQHLQPFTWDSFDPVALLKDVLLIMCELFKIGYVHGSIDESVFFKDNQGHITLGKLEKTLRRSDSPQERAKDLKDVACIIASHITGKKGDPMLIDLLDDLRSEDPMERPTPSEALGHPLFWSSQDRIVFLSKANDFLRSEMANRQGFRAHFDKHSQHVTGKDWKRYVDRELVKEASYKIGYYSGTTTSDLIRLIRNKWQHPAASPSLEYLQDPDEYFKYFHGLFPNLFLYTYYFYDNYNNIQDHCL